MRLERRGDLLAPLKVAASKKVLYALLPYSCILILHTADQQELQQVYAVQVNKWTRKLWAAVLAEFLGMTIFEIYGGNAPNSVAAYGNGITLGILGAVLLHPCIAVRVLADAETDVKWKFLIRMGRTGLSYLTTALVKLELLKLGRQVQK